jgi:glucan phosphoethanolaminetransferase (alkaline phosphatase superfamily)
MEEAVVDASPSRRRAASVKRALFGDRPRSLLLLLAPTLLGVMIDAALRARQLAIAQPHGKAIYFSALLVSAAFWVLPLLCAARLLRVEGRRRAAARLAIVLFFGLWVFPIVSCSYGGQALFFRVFSAYAGRDTLRLGALLRGSLWAWFFAWGDSRVLLEIAVVGALVTLGLFGVVWRTAPHVTGRFPLLPVLTFAGAIFCLWTDNVDSRFLQSATPDVCFLNGAVHMLRAATTGAGRVREGVTIRRPAALPPLSSARRQGPPNVIVILTESVRADASCSERAPDCLTPFLDDVAPDRIGLGKLTSQTPNTFSAAMVLWTGLSPNADFADAHAAPTLWELAHAVGYRTAYITSQNARYEDLGVFVHGIGADVIETSNELGGMEHEQLGAPDERAVAEMLRFVREAAASGTGGSPDPRTPYFGLLHLSNTHHPYRVDPDLQPFAPHSDHPSAGVAAYHNHYRNSVRMQERMLASFLRDLRALPSWDETVVVFLSDHGEPFGEHGIVHHNHSVFDEELRVPGWIVSGSRGLGAAERQALRTYAGVRTFTTDIHVTILDLFGLERARQGLPFSNLVPGRTLLRRHEPEADPTVLLATATGVWEPNDPWFGVMRRENVLIASPKTPWRCFDLVRDPGERSPRSAEECGALINTAATAFGPGVGPAK